MQLHSSVPVRTEEVEESEAAHHPTARLSPSHIHTPCPSHSRGFPCQLLLLDPRGLAFVPAALAEVVPKAFLCLNSCKHWRGMGWLEAGFPPRPRRPGDRYGAPQSSLHPHLHIEVRVGDSPESRARAQVRTATMLAVVYSERR